MSSVNLSICLAPSILWPDSGLDVVKNEVPPLVQFMIEHCLEIFGDDLPELYKQAAKSSNLGVESMEFGLERAVHYVPTKKGDDGPVCHQGRVDSMEAGYSSDDSHDDEPGSNLRRMRDTGLTASDSQISTISQLDDYELEVERSRRFGALGTAQLMNRMTAKLSTEAELLPQKQLPSAKRVKRSHRPERSHSYRTADEKPRHVQMRYRAATRSNGTRRKSIATQTTLPRKYDFDSKMQQEAAPTSHNSLSSSSAHGLSPHAKREHKATGDLEAPAATAYPFLTEGGSRSPRRHARKFKAAAPLQYSSSFSQGSDNKPPKPLPTSNSFYDKLLPLDQDLRPRSRSMGNNMLLSSLQHQQSPEDMELGGTVMEVANMTWPSDQKEQQQLRCDPLLAQILKGSDQSISSTQSGSSGGSSQQQLLQSLLGGGASSPMNRPGKLSLGPAVAPGNGRPSPDMLAELENVPLGRTNREFLEVAISKRFALPTGGADWQAGQGPPHSETEPSYAHGMPVISHKQFSDSFEREIESVQRRLHERKSLDHGSVGGTAPELGEKVPHRGHSYHGYTPAQQQAIQRKKVST